mmetsp:Transcript_84699/g.188165  ORF Transcript_84699/g.188165 Transcript_84699/m.188165 type:complete len:151 (+) Transcript_84699:3-455(+)
MSAPETRLKALRAVQVGSEGSNGNKLRVIQGTKRFQVIWDASDRADDLAKRIEETSGVPAGQQELRLADGEFLTGGGSQLAKVANPDGRLPTVWLVDSKAEDLGVKWGLVEADDEWFPKVVRGLAVAIVLGTAIILVKSADNSGVGTSGS